MTWDQQPQQPHGGSTPPNDPTQQYPAQPQGDPYAQPQGDPYAQPVQGDPYAQPQWPAQQQPQWPAQPEQQQWPAQPQTSGFGQTSGQQAGGFGQTSGQQYGQQYPDPAAQYSAQAQQQAYGQAQYAQGQYGQAQYGQGQYAPQGYDQLGQGQAKPGSKRAVGIIVAVVIAAVLGGAGWFLVHLFTSGGGGGGTTADPVTDVDAPVQVSGFDLRPGMCLEPTSTVDADGNLTRVPCSSAHAGEVISEMTVADGTWPGQAEIEKKGEETCDNSAANAARDNLPSGDQDKFGSMYFYPTEETWADGDRLISCIVEADDNGATMTGSLLTGKVTVG